MAELDPRPLRKDLTSRECASLIGALLGSLVTFADIDDVRSALAWWAENDDAWDALDLLGQSARDDSHAPPRAGNGSKSSNNRKISGN